MFFLLYDFGNNSNNNDNYKIVESEHEAA